MDTKTHSLATLPAYRARWLGFTDGTTPLPVALGNVQRLDAWVEVDDPATTARPGRSGFAGKNKRGVRYQTLSVLVSVDARPLSANAKAPPLRVFYSGTLDIDLDEGLNVLRAEVGRFEYADAPGGKTVAVPCPTGWRRAGSGYTGQSLKVHEAIVAWAKSGAPARALGPCIPYRAKDSAESVKRAEREAKEERNAIEAGQFDDWNTPARRVHAATRADERAQEHRDEVARLLDLTARVAALGGVSEEEQGIAAARARNAIRMSEIARAQAEKRAVENAKAAEAARVRLEAEKAARERLEAAAPALLAAAEAAAKWMEDRALHGHALTGLVAAIAQAKGTAS
jgi:hypothetical protein